MFPIRIGTLTPPNSKIIRGGTMYPPSVFRYAQLCRVDKVKSQKISFCFFSHRFWTRTRRRCQKQRKTSPRMGDCLGWSWLGGDAGQGPGREPWKSQVFWLIKESKIWTFGSSKKISTLSAYFVKRKSFQRLGLYQSLSSLQWWLTQWSLPSFTTLTAEILLCL